MALPKHAIRPASLYYNTIAKANQPSTIFRGLLSESSSLSYRKLSMKQKSKAEPKEIAAKKHSEAERRRRLRINCQYATLRTILPNLVKFDKASVLGETVRHLNKLNKTVKELKSVCPDQEDNLKISRCHGDGEEGLVKAVFSSQDKPGIMSELARSMTSANGKVIRVEMVAVGGRIKCVIWVQGVNGKEGMVRLTNALKRAVVNKQKTVLV